MNEIRRDLIEQEAHIERFRAAVKLAHSKPQPHAIAVEMANAIWDETYITKAETERLKQEQEQRNPLPIDLTDKGVKVGDRVEYIPAACSATVLDYNDRGTVVATREDYATVEWDDDEGKSTVAMSRLAKLVADKAGRSRPLEMKCPDCTGSGVDPISGGMDPCPSCWGIGRVERRRKDKS